VGGGGGCALLMGVWVGSRWWAVEWVAVEWRAGEMFCVEVNSGQVVLTSAHTHTHSTLCSTVGTRGGR
jgi:hypothetical protein